MQDLGLTVFDIAAFGIVLLSMLLSLVRGAVREALLIASWVGAFVAAYYLFPILQTPIREAIGSDLIADLIAAATGFLVPLVILKVLTGMMAKGIEDSSFGGIDKLLGLVFGFLRGVVIVCLGFMLLDAVFGDEGKPAWVAQARTLPYAQVGADFLRQFLPEGAEEQATEAAGRLGDAVGSGNLDELTRPLPSEQGSGYSEEQAQDLDQTIEQLPQ
ncbi:MAG: CvpA family protein [Geminicoccaceae bacterium]